MSCNSNQNHLVQAGRTTSRVLAPPGGKCSISLGVAPPPKKIPNEPPKDSVVTVTATEDKKEVVENEEIKAEPKTTVKEKVADQEHPSDSNQKPTAPTAAESVSANAFVTGANMNGGCVMTGRPTSRVLAPPGGHCSIKLG